MDAIPFDASACADRFLASGIRGLMHFQKRENRDAVWRILKSRGIVARRNAARNQEMHPQYIEDYQGEEKYQTGFGNTVYKTFFARVYGLEHRDFGMSNWRVEGRAQYD